MKNIINNNISIYKTISSSDGWGSRECKKIKFIKDIFAHIEESSIKVKSNQIPMFFYQDVRHFKSTKLFNIKTLSINFEDLCVEVIKYKKDYLFLLEEPYLEGAYAVFRAVKMDIDLDEIKLDE